MDSNDLEILKKIDKLITYDDILVDVGANNGNYTEYFNKKLNNSGRIYSVELHPNTFEVLKTKFSNFSNILLFNNAICNKNELIDYYSGVDSYTNNIIGHDMSFNENKKIGQIQGITLDELLKNEEKIKLIKIDVEGAELLVLNGMTKTFKKLEYLLIECHLDRDWNKIKKILLTNFDCENGLSGELINETSVRCYQCLCKKKL